MTPEMKAALEAATKTIESMRSELDGMKSADVVDAAKLAKAEADLASKFRTEAAMKTELKALEDRLAEIELKAGRPGGFGNAAQVDEHKQAFVHFLRNREDNEAKSALQAIERKAVNVSTGTSSAGGYAVPKEISSSIIKLVQDVSPIRQLCGSITVSTPDYREIVDLGGTGYEWVGEGDTRSKTNTADLGEITPTFGTIHAIMETTVEAIDDMFFAVEPWLIAGAAEKFSAAEGAAFVSGNGTKKPTGFLNGATSEDADGTRAFGTYQHIITGVAADLSANPYDQLISLVFGTKAAYRANAGWAMNSATLAKHALVKDDQGQYILQRAVKDGIGSMILGYGVAVAEDMPSIAADALPVGFGDFRKGYRIADIHGMRVIVDNVTKPGFVRLIVAKRVGGTPADTQALKFLKVAAAA